MDNSMREIFKMSSKLQESVNFNDKRHSRNSCSSNSLSRDHIPFELDEVNDNGVRNNNLSLSFHADHKSSCPILLEKDSFFQLAKNENGQMTQRQRQNDSLLQTYEPEKGLIYTDRKSMPELPQAHLQEDSVPIENFYQTQKTPQTTDRKAVKQFTEGYTLRESQKSIP